MKQIICDKCKKALTENEIVTTYASIIRFEIPERIFLKELVGRKFVVELCEECVEELFKFKNK